MSDILQELELLSDEHIRAGFLLEHNVYMEAYLRIKELRAKNERLLVVCKDKHEAMNNYKLSCEDFKAENEKLKDLNHGYSGNIMDMDLERAEVLEVLEEMEWQEKSEGGRVNYRCYFCHNIGEDEHTDDCKLNTLIRKMEGTHG